MCVDLSVVICTHNPRTNYFQRVLNALRNQTMPLTNWELVIVDNASDSPVLGGWDVAWHPQAKVIREEELGLTPARLRGIKESTCDLLLFVDDDNVLEENYLDRALRLMKEHPYLAVIGAGRLEPEFEAQPSPELVPILPMLALRSVSSLMWSNNPKDNECIPWGAGLCVRRTTAESYAALVSLLKCSAVLDRRGQQLFCGGDDLFSWAAARSGKGFGIFPELRVLHLILSGRLTRSYFLRLIHDHSFSHGVLRYLLANMEPEPAGVPGFLKILLHGTRNGSFSMRCRFASFRGTAAARQFISTERLTPVSDTSSALPV